MDQEKKGGGFYPAASVGVRPAIKKAILAMDDENAVGGSSASCSRAVLAKTQDRLEEVGVRPIR